MPLFKNASVSSNLNNRRFRGSKRSSFKQRATKRQHRRPPKSFIGTLKKFQGFDLRVLYLYLYYIIFIILNIYIYIIFIYIFQGFTFRG